MDVLKEDLEKKGSNDDDVAETIEGLIVRFKETECPQLKLFCILQIIEVAISNYQ